jgi:hypothetical protein
MFSIGRVGWDSNTLETEETAGVDCCGGGQDELIVEFDMRRVCHRLDWRELVADDVEGASGAGVNE